MPYTTPASVRQALVPSADGALPEQPTHTAADLPDQQLFDSIREADALIDGYIGGYYAVPVVLIDGDTAPSPLGFWSRTVAAYLATCTYRGSLDFTDNDPVARRYTEVLSNLKDVAAGRLKLQIATNVGPHSSAGVGQAVNPYQGDLWQPEDFSVNPAHDWSRRGRW